MRLTILVLLGAAVSVVSSPAADDELPISFGVKAGVPITDAFNTVKGDQSSYFTNTKRYLIGPTFELHLPLQFSIEVDALYRRLGYDYYEPQPGGAVFANTTANSWQFPILVKWAFLPGPVRPFVDVGASVQHVSGIEQIQSSLAAIGIKTDRPAEFNTATDVGLTVGGGVQFKVGPVRISPEFRYTRWGSETFRDPVQTFLNTNRNQGDFLLGLTF
jgi:opacity protein-like surface antigen